MAGDNERSDDELGRTATAAGSPGGHAREAAALTGELGRYRLHRELGRGGMGVVHAAFDPDLERKVALKVLRSTEGDEARQRLLREARAMARLAHPNVVTVHEVGSTSGRDYIAMELIDGGTLEDWLAEAPRTERDIVHAFVAAGKGLAAAHAAGLVHRDFKPRNVLRHRDGRIVVTDFGLVVGVDTVPVDPLTTTLPAGQGNAATAHTTPSSLSGLTATGSVLGTPAYMAPEQWTGGQVGPRTDQFAFCVALWEALTKQRPYTGTTLDELKQQVGAGTRVDDSKLPRRLRKILARGLEPDPARRWPSMDALLAAIMRSERRPTIAIGIAASVLAVAGVAVVVVGSRHAAPGCPLPVLDPQVVWSPHEADQLRQQHQDLAAAAIERDMTAWRQARGRACTQPLATREPTLACLDGVLGRMDTVKRAVLAVKSAPRIEIASWLVDPAVCEAVRPPRLGNLHSEELRTVLAAILDHGQARTAMTDAELDQMLAAANPEPCASAYAHAFAAGNRPAAQRQRELDDAERAAQLCGDDRVVADVAVGAATQDVSTFSPDGRDKVTRAAALVERVSQPDLEAHLELLHAIVAVEDDNMDQAIQHFGNTAALYAKRGLVRAPLRARLGVIRYLRIRGDAAAIASTLEQVRAEAVARLGEQDEVVRSIDQERAQWMWTSGDIENADALREKLVDPLPADNPRTVRGRVVDEHGAPVVGADVMTGGIQGDSLHAMIASDQVRSAKTGGDGRFEIRDAESEGLAIAQLGDRRSVPQRVADDMTLTLAPTSRISGKLDLHGQPAIAVTVAASDKSLPLSIGYVLTAPVHADGSFTLAGVPRGNVQVRTWREGLLGTSMASIDLSVTAPVVDGLSLDVRAGVRTLRVLVRSVFNVGLPNSQVFLVPGKQASTTLRAVVATIQDAQTKNAVPVQAEQASPEVEARSKPGDLFALFTGVADGEITACALPLPEHLDDPELAKQLQKPENMEKVLISCVPVAPNDDVIVIEVQPWPRFD